MSPERPKSESDIEKKVTIGRVFGIPVRISQEMFGDIARLRGEGKTADQAAEELDKMPAVVRLAYKNLARREQYKKDRD